MAPRTRITAPRTRITAPRTRLAGAVLLAAAALAGCGTGAGVASPEPARAAQTATLPAKAGTPQGTLLVVDFGSDTATRQRVDRIPYETETGPATTG
ncbi:hypothetical protein ACQB60_11410 [Actinomycetota bacterium Odt1-20B]